MFQNCLSTVIYIAYTTTEMTDIPKVQGLQPNDEVVVETSKPYYLSIVVNNKYIYDSQMSIAPMVAVEDDRIPTTVFQYGFDVETYKRNHPNVAVGVPLYTETAQNIVKHMLSKLRR